MSKQKPRKGKPPPAPPRFAVGTTVRVKPGTTVPDFADVPLGGWAGTITEVDQRAPTTYLVVWNRQTLEQMHPVYRKRCERDDLAPESMWLGENDLVPDDGLPAAIEQPTVIRTRPLDLKDQDDRVRAALGLTGDDPVPDVGEETLRKYHWYLAAHLSFPFDAAYSRETGFLRDRIDVVTVTGLLEVDDGDDAFHGLFCDARRGRERLDLPLGEIEVKKGDPNRRLVADYSYWFWNWR